jgi:dihydrofolate reductase
MCVTREAPRVEMISRFRAGTSSKSRAPAPSVTGATWVRSSSMWSARRYWLIVAAPPAIATLRSPAAAGEKYVAILGASTTKQVLHAGLLDEILVRIASVLLGDGVRLLDHPEERKLDWQASC